MAGRSPAVRSSGHGTTHVARAPACESAKADFLMFQPRVSTRGDRRQPNATSPSEVVQHAKGASSHLVTQVLDPGGFFKWQGYHGAFSLSKRQVPHVRDYILRQAEHHLGGTVIQALERIFH
jgi:hypothetical protein